MMFLCRFYDNKAINRIFFNIFAWAYVVNVYILTQKFICVIACDTNEYH